MYEKCSKSPAIREMQIKTTMRYHFTPAKMAIINKSTNKHLGGCGEKGSFRYCWGEWRFVQPLWKTAWNFLKKLKKWTAFLPSDSTVGNIPQGYQNTNSKEFMHPLPPVFIAVQFTITKIWKQPKCPSVDEWIKKDVVHLHNGILSSRKKKESLHFVTAWMELETIMLSEISQSVKD